MNADAKPRLMLIGLDGADLDYMRPWLDAGKLPHLAALIEQGALMPLATTAIDHTIVAWPVLFTGKNPGKTGYMDMVYRQRGTYEMPPVSLEGIKTQPFWAYLSEQGLRTLVINVPTTYPPQPFDGAIACGYDAPKQATNYAWPEEFKQHLLADGYHADVFEAQHAISMQLWVGRHTPDHKPFLEACRTLTVQMAGHIKRLMSQQDWDVVFVGYQLTDFINHFTARQQSHLQVYQMADALIGELLSLAGDHTTVMVASDHGSGVSERCIGLARLMADFGFTRYKPLVNAEVIPGIVMRFIPERLRARFSTDAQVKKIMGLWKMLPEWIRYLLSWLPLRFYPGWAHYYSNIDWQRTKAYVASGIKTVYINRKDVFPQGIVASGAEYEALCDEIREKFTAVRDPETQEPVFDVRRASEVWHGPQIDDLAPDLILSLKNEDYMVFSNDALGRSFWNGDVEATGGCHRPHGMLLVKGGAIKPGVTLPPAQIADLVPTLLYLMNTPLPKSLDGKPVTDAVQPKHLAQHPVQIEAFARPETYQPLTEGYSDAEAENVMEKLRALGYIE